MARWLGIGFLLALAMLVSGCGGCRRDPDAGKTREELEKESVERKKKEAERHKPDFEVKRLASRPPVGSSVAGCGVKPGHWTCVALEDAKANHFDFAGELEMIATRRDGSPLAIEATPFELAVCRDVTLPKGKERSLESLLFVPPGSKSVWAAYQFNAGKGGRSVVEFPHDPLMGLMPSWQYHLVVLASKPEPYAYLERLDSVRPASGPDVDRLTTPYYRVALFKADRRAALPAHADQWTSIACVLWDDASLDALDVSQQQAMVDWLHWGGQLIVSGPNSLDGLRNSFLGPYLPATAEGVKTLGRDELAALNAFSGKTIRALAPARPWNGIRLKIHPEAEFVPGSGELLVERRVGRGRIVASAFRLSEREFVDWPGCDETYNAMLLRRPPRQRVVDKWGDGHMLWADGARQYDARRVTPLRYFVRDTGVPFSQYAADAIVADREQDRPYSRRTSSSDEVTAAGVAAWNDFNPVAQAARETLQNAARIEIPRREFVMWVVAVYLVVLVPANWLLFRSIRRVEWAWIAAPAIAVVCTVVVIRLAQLDIGFARSQTEVAIVEIQGDHARAHVARYNALYTSLATSYELTGDDPGAAILPFPTAANPEPVRTSIMEQIRRLTCRRGEHVALSGLFVRSNSTGLAHSEEMFDLGGGISLRGCEKMGTGSELSHGDSAKTASGEVPVPIFSQPLSERDDATGTLVNRSTLNLNGVGLLRRTRSGELQAAWVGEVPIAKPTGVRWVAVSSADAAKPLWGQQREQSPLSASNPPPGTLNLRKLLDLAQDVQSLDAGEVRLIGWSDDDLPGLSIKPAAPQVKRGILVIAHLRYGYVEPPQADLKPRSESTP